MTSSKDDNKKTELATIDKEEAIIREYQDTLITDALLRITAIENLLMRRGLITEAEIVAEITLLSNAISKSVSDALLTQINTATPAEVEGWVKEFSVVGNKLKTDKNSN